MTKKVLITNSSAFTVGDVAISNCMVEQILKVIPDAQITIESGNSVIHRQYISDKNIRIIQRLFDTRSIVYSRSYLSVTFLKRNFRLVFIYLFDAFELLLFSIFRKNFTHRKIFDAMAEADVVISAGGDALTSNYGFFLRLYEFALMKVMKKRIVIYASTIGPFSGLPKLLTIHSLKRIDLILARDKKSYDFLIQNGLNKSTVKQTADCAILLNQKNTVQVERTVKKLEITRKTIGIFLKTNAFSSVVSGQHTKYLEKMCETVAKLAELGYGVVFFAANNTDYETTIDFIKTFNISHKLINIMRFQANEAKELLSKTGLIITSRMHPAILASTSGVPIIGISDETKMLEYLKIINTPELYLKQSDFEVRTIIGLVKENVGNNRTNHKLKKGLIHASRLANKNTEYLDSWMNNEGR